MKWTVASVVGVRDETLRARTLVIDVPDWPGHRAGQHVDVRLVAEDGYQAQRSYSIASPPESRQLELTVERIDDGEVSPYLCDVLHVGDGLEVRGPIGGYFVWDVRDAGPVLLVAGGSGIVPLMAMMRHRARADANLRALSEMSLLYSTRTLGDLFYLKEIERLVEEQHVRAAFTLTREKGDDRRGYHRRIDKAMLTDVGWAPSHMPRCYVCGPTPLVESVAKTLVELGHDPSRVLTERFGPTG